MLALAASPSGAADWNTGSLFRSGTASDVRAWLAAGADPMARGQYGVALLHFAAMQTDGSRIVEALLDACADPMARAEYGFTPLHTAAMSLGESVGMALLPEAGADPNVRALGELTPLHVIGLRAQEASPLHGSPALLDVRSGSKLARYCSRGTPKSAAMSGAMTHP